MFGNFDAATAIAYAGENLPEGLAEKTQSAWTAFATTGNPSISGEVEWPKYNMDTRSTMIIDDKPWEIADDPKPEGRTYMRDMYEAY